MVVSTPSKAFIAKWRRAISATPAMRLDSRTLLTCCTKRPRAPLIPSLASLEAL
jgi:hypothetical protein